MKKEFIKKLDHPSENKEKTAKVKNPLQSTASKMPAGMISLVLSTSVVFGHNPDEIPSSSNEVSPIKRLERIRQHLTADANRISLTHIPEGSTIAQWLNWELCQVKVLL